MDKNLLCKTSGNQKINDVIVAVIVIAVVVVIVVVVVVVIVVVIWILERVALRPVLENTKEDDDLR